MLRPSKPFCLLYLSYSLACIGDRMWNFAIVLILGRLGGMRLVAINQFTKGVTGILLSSCNASIAALATFLTVCISVNLEHSRSNVFDTENIIYGIFLFFSLLVSAVSRCASGGQKIVYTKDWVVVMAQSLDSESLSSHNSMMFAISQTTAVIAPLATGFIFVSMGQRLACALLGAWNLISWIMEHCLLSNIYRLVPELANRRNICIALNNIDPKEIERLLNEKEREIFQPTCFWKKVWSIYSRQQVFHVSIGYSLLYMTVLGLGGVSISYGK
uniref:Solute carrier family 40 member n=1 Tax=Ditylenchus dipsaci TaxID=166011 RepID=A0A915ECV4_9BILA